MGLSPLLSRLLTVFPTRGFGPLWLKTTALGPQGGPFFSLTRQPSVTEPRIGDEVVVVVVLGAEDEVWAVLVGVAWAWWGWEEVEEGEGVSLLPCGQRPLQNKARDVTFQSRTTYSGTSEKRTASVERLSSLTTIGGVSFVGRSSLSRRVLYQRFCREVLLMNGGCGHHYTTMGVVTIQWWVWSPHLWHFKRGSNTQGWVWSPHPQRAN